MITEEQEKELKKISLELFRIQKELGKENSEVDSKKIASKIKKTDKKLLKVFDVKFTDKTKNSFLSLMD